MDPENIGKEAIIRVTDWLRGIWEMKRNGGPVQQWVDSIPSPTKSTVNIQIDCPDSPSSAPEHSRDLSCIKKPVMTVSAPISVPSSPAITMTSIPSSAPHSRLARDPSLQSDSSHCSSVESLLELRKADPEAILLGLGFGGCSSNSEENGTISRIPKRFLQPSKLKGIAIDDFMKQQQETNESIDSASLGYRGLTGSPYVAPSEIVQKIMERLREHESHELDVSSSHNSDPYTSTSLQEGRLSVLSPDNRQFLERQRSKSPDMRNKRMIIGQKSFAFSGDGDLIEIHPTNRRHSKSNGTSTDYKTDPTCSFKSESMDGNSPERSRKKIVKQKAIEPDSSESLSGSDPSSIDQKLTRGLVSSKESSEETDSEVQIDFESLRKSQKQLSSRKSTQESDADSSNARRASEGSCDIGDVNLRLSHDTGRRFSDVIIRPCSNVSSVKRRSFRRQARISDAEATLYCGSECSDPVVKELLPVSQEKEESLQFPEDLQERLEPEEQREAACNSERSHLCCKNDQLNQICRHEPTVKDCCYHESSTNCWRKMRRILKKNQKLETMVEKNRQEMAEIRDMLNNVLSVRMEPGF